MWGSCVSLRNKREGPKTYRLLSHIQAGVNSISECDEDTMMKKRMTENSCHTGFSQELQRKSVSVVKREETLRKIKFVQH